MHLTEIMMTAFVNFFADKMPLIITAITAACIIAAGPEIVTSGYKKIYNWFNDKDPENIKTIVAFRDGKRYEWNFDLNQNGKDHDAIMNHLKQQGMVAYSPYLDNLDLHDNSITYLKQNGLADSDDLEEEADDQDAIDQSAFSENMLNQHYAKMAHSSKDDDEDYDYFDNNVNQARNNNLLPISDFSAYQSRGSDYSPFAGDYTPIDFKESNYNDDGSLDFDVSDFDKKKEY